MLNTMLSICKYLQEKLTVSPFNFKGEIKVGHASWLDINAELPKILVNDVLWRYEPFQFGTFEMKRLAPLEVEIFAGDKLFALEMVSWITGKTLRGYTDGDGVLLKTEIPLWRFAADKKTIMDDPDNPGSPWRIGKIIFGDDPLPSTRFSVPVDTAELAYNYIISFDDVCSLLEV